MRRLLLCLSLLALPCLAAAAQDHHDHTPYDDGMRAEPASGHGEQASLEAHEHGHSRLNLVLEQGMLDVELRSPAINLLGFEHAPISSEDKRRLTALRQALAAPASLLGLPDSCRQEQQDIDSPLFEPPAHQPSGHQGEHAGHHDVFARYRFDCSAAPLSRLDLAPLFQRYPGTERLQVQLIGPDGQRGLELTPHRPTLDFQAHDD